MTYKAVVIGCGWVGLGAQKDVLRPTPATHAQAVTVNARMSLAGLVDETDEAIRLANTLYPGVPTWSRVEEMLRATVPDVAIIATPPDTHCALVKMCAASGVRAILCEKPISHDQRESADAVRVCNERGVLLFVNHMRRFDPLVREMRDHLRGGYVRDTCIGVVCAGTAYYDKGIFHGGTHIVDLLRFFLGEVRSVSATKNEWFQVPADDFALDGLLMFDSANVSIQAFNTPDWALAEINLFGSRGRMSMRRMWGLEFEIVGTRTSVDVSAYRELNYADPIVFGGRRSLFAHTLDHVADCLDGRCQPFCSGLDAHKTLEVICALRDSALNEGKRIHVHEDE